MISINLKNLVFYNDHGLLLLEKIVKGEFHVSVEILFDENAIVQSLDQTIDYSKVYDIVKQRMSVTTSLLETLSMEIGHEIEQRFSFIKYIRVDIQKVHPPIENINGSVGVSWFKNIY